MITDTFSHQRPDVRVGSGTRRTPARQRWAARLASAAALLALATSVTVLPASARTAENLQWSHTDGQDMPTERSYFSTVAGSIDGLSVPGIFAIGGYDDRHAALNSMEIMNPMTRRWIGAEPMPTRRGATAAAQASDGRVIVFGGVTDVRGLNTTEAYDLDSNSWARVAKMPSKRANLGAATGSDGMIYTIGGNAPKKAGVTAKPVKSVAAYDPRSNTWRSAPAMPTARMQLGVTAGPDGRIYAIGGQGTGSRILSTVEAYDPRTRTWTTLAPLPTARAALAVTTGPDGRIYAVGGRTAGGIVDTVEAYDPATNTWTTGGSTSYPRGGLGLATTDGRMYAIGGATNDAGFATNLVQWTDATVDYVNNQVAGIPDPGTMTSTTGVQNRPGMTTKVDVAVTIRHTYRGDLTLDLIAPDGTSARLVTGNGEGGYDLVGEWTADFPAGVSRNGTWTLQVTDDYEGDRGYLETWTLTL